MTKKANRKNNSRQTNKHTRNDKTLHKTWNSLEMSSYRIGTIFEGGTGFLSQQSLCLRKMYCQGKGIFMIYRIFRHITVQDVEAINAFWKYRRIVVEVIYLHWQRSQSGQTIDINGPYDTVDCKHCFLWTI